MPWRPTRRLSLAAVRRLAVHCRGCERHLLTYRKGGKGQLVKCFVDRILWNGTDSVDPCRCPDCGTEFCRVTRIKNRPAYKIIGGKVFTRKG